MKKIIIILSLLALVTNSCDNRGQIRTYFEDSTGLDFPPSGKVIEQDDNGFALDWWCSGVIEMDTLDYMNILNNIQMRADSLIIDENITYRRLSLSDSETIFASFEEHRDSHGRRYWLSFYKNKRMIKCFFESI